MVNGHYWMLYRSKDQRKGTLVSEYLLNLTFLHIFYIWIMHVPETNIVNTSWRDWFIRYLSLSTLTCREGTILKQDIYNKIYLDNSKKCKYMFNERLSDSIDNIYISPLNASIEISCICQMMRFMNMQWWTMMDHDGYWVRACCRIM